MLILIISILFVISLSVVVVLLCKLKQDAKVVRGTCMTIRFDEKFQIKDIVNARHDILNGHSEQSLIGVSFDDFVPIITQNDPDGVQCIIKNVNDAMQTKSDAFFEYGTDHADGTKSQTMCYAEYQKRGMLIHFVRLDVAKRIRGCGKCMDYILSLGMNSLSVGVYAKRVGGNEKYSYTNQVAKNFCNFDDITKSEFWNQQEEDDADLKVVLTKAPVMYEKIVYDESGEPKNWYNVLKVMQSTGFKGDYIVTSITDVTEQKQREYNLEVAKKFLAISIGAGDVAVWRYNIKDDKYYCLYGNMYVAEQASMEESYKIIHPDCLAAYKNACENLMLGNTNSESLILNVINPDNGQYYYIRSLQTVSLSPSGGVTDIIGTQKVITDDEIKTLEMQVVRDSLDMAIIAGNILAWEFDMDCRRYRIIYGNLEPQYSEAILNHDSAEAVAASVHPIDLPRYMDFVHELELNGGKGTIVVRGIDKSDGEQTFYEMSVSAVKNYKGVVNKLFGTRRDISEAQRQKIELEKTQKNLALAMEAGGVSVWLYDVTKEMFFTLQGNTIAGEGLSMKDNLTMMHPDDAVECQHIIDSMSSGKMDTCNVIYRFKADDIEGGYRYYEARKIVVKEGGKIKYITGTQKEVTKEQFHKKELEESNLKTKLALAELQRIVKYNQVILDNSNSGLVYITPDFVVRWDNLSVIKSLHSCVDLYVKNQCCYNSFYGLDAPCDNCLMIEAVSNRTQTTRETMINDNAVVDVTATPVFDNDDVLEGVVLKIDDITLKKKALKELQEAKEKAERSDKFKSTFLANMSHEIRTPLNAIVGFSELLADVNTPEEKREYSKIIAANNELLLKLVNDILDLSKIEAGFININNDKFDLSELFNELSITMLQRMPSGVEFICQKPGGKCGVVLDRNRVTQIVTNFITNAIKFTKSGYIKMGFERTDNGVKIFVSDTGIGISEDKLKDVFVRFEKLNDFAQGTGLGLSICKSIVEAQNGTIGVDSVVGQGSTFWAMLPCEILDSQIELPFEVDDNNISECCSGKEEPHGEDEACNENLKRILVAEDVDSNFRLLKSMLKNRYNITHVQNGEMAVSEVKNNVYDCVLMDIKMPTMDGLEAIRKIREFNSDIPIIVSTANVFDSDKQVAFDAGCNKFLTKPIDKATLLDALSTLIK